MKQRTLALLVGALTIMTAIPANATAPHPTVAYQVMVSTGLAARNPFEAWFDFDKWMRAAR